MGFLSDGGFFLTQEKVAPALLEGWINQMAMQIKDCPPPLPLKKKTKQTKKKTETGP